MALSAWLDMPQRAFRGGTRSGASNENWKCRWERPRDPDDMVGAAGIEPATLGLEIRCSIRLSYAPALINTGEEVHCRNLTLTHRDARSPHRSPDETAFL